ncbi:MAG: MFS transporter [Halioglobus sp.]|nr:MFS transporter [Halioglobus sp.]
MFYGWRIVAGAFTTQMFIVGFFTYSASLLIPHLQREFAVSLEQVMYSMTIGTFTGLLLSPVAGALVDRASVRALMVAGSLAFAGGLALMARTSDITQYVWCFGLTMTIGNCFGAMIPAAAVVSRWFTVNRGRALGIAAIGTSAGGAVLPGVMEFWLADGDWRGALDNLALCVVVIMVPAAFLLIRGRPEDVNMLPEPDPHAGDGVVDAAVGSKAILSSANFWCMAISLGLVLGAYSAVLSNLAPYVIAAGFESSAGSTLIMVLAISGLVGKLIFGSAADRLNLKIALWLAEALAIIALLLFAFAGESFAVMLAAAISMGLASGGLLPVWGAMLARLFGLASYGLAMGLMSPVVTLCIMPTFVLVGRLVDTYGTFLYPLLAFAGATAFAMAILLPLRLPERAAAA